MNWHALDVFTRSLTLVTTYTCTAACEQCCFGCTPSSEGRLSLEQMTDAIRQAKASFPALRLVVFTGGECFLLKADLLAAIGEASEANLLTRCVTNGYWGKSARKAQDIARNLRLAGLTELNFSTGKDHQKWVPFSSVLNAVSAALDQNIVTLVTIERDASDSTVETDIFSNPVVIDLLSTRATHFRVQVNAWMPFTQNAERRNSAGAATGPCPQLFENVVVTPHAQVSACCGLTYEHIPEMILGSLERGRLREVYESQANDFLKTWLRVEGPAGIVRSVLPTQVAEQHVDSCDHICQLCALVHQDAEIRSSIADKWTQHVGRVQHAFAASALGACAATIVESTT
jgi:organic radical activating enzyme